MKELVAAVEAAYARGRPPALDDATRAAACAIASRFLAVGTPRTIGLALDADAARLALEAHRVFFAPREIRTPATHSLAEVCACDIVCAADIAIEARWIRRGTHLNVSRVALDPELIAAARVVDHAGLVEIAAGRVDGRSLDEITVFTA